MKKFTILVFLISVFAFFSSNLIAHGGDQYGVKRHGYGHNHHSADGPGHGHHPEPGNGHGHGDHPDPWHGHDHNWPTHNHNDGKSELAFKAEIDHSGESHDEATTDGYGEDGYGESFTDSVRNVSTAIDFTGTLFPKNSDCDDGCEGNKGMMSHHMDSSDEVRALQWSAGTFGSGARADTATDNWYNVSGHMEIDRD